MAEWIRWSINCVTCWNRYNQGLGLCSECRSRTDNIAKFPKFKKSWHEQQQERKLKNV